MYEVAPETADQVNSVELIVAVPQLIAGDKLGLIVTVSTTIHPLLSV